jgi:hypothetical protein
MQLVGICLGLFNDSFQLHEFNDQLERKWCALDMILSRRSALGTGENTERRH